MKRLKSTERETCFQSTRVGHSQRGIKTALSTNLYLLATFSMINLGFVSRTEQMKDMGTHRRVSAQICQGILFPTIVISRGEKVQIHSALEQLQQTTTS